MPKGEDVEEGSGDRKRTEGGQSSNAHRTDIRCVPGEAIQETHRL